MSVITISEPRTYVERGWPAVRATIGVQGQSHDVYFRSEKGPLAAHVGPFIMSALPAAMRLGLPIQAAGPVSPSFLDGVERMQRLFLFFFPAMHHVDITVPLAEDAFRPQMAQRGAGLFFSGGVDSFYTLLTHRDTITHLFYVHGFDTLLSNQTARAFNARALRQAAAEGGKEFFEYETNARTMLDRYERWLHPSATSLQFAIALTLMQHFATVYVAENYPYSSEQPRDEASFVISDAGPTVVPDGLDAMRLEKIKYIASSPLAMRWLRVCWQNLGLTYNCGRCEKCLRTMIGLELAGSLDRCRTFKNGIDIERVRATDLDKFARFWPELLLDLEKSGAYPELAQAVREAVQSSSTEPFRWQRMLAHLEQRGDMPELAGVVRECLAYSQAPSEQRQQAIQLREARAQVLELKRELAIVTSSQSWKLTAPLRSVGRIIRQRRARVG